MTDKQVDSEYIPTIVQIPKTNDPFKTELSPAMNSIVEYPKFSFGFHHFMHQSKGKLKILDQFEGKKKVYLVMNKFERYIDDYDQDLNNVSLKYFDLKNKTDILNRSFFKMWELMMYFDIVPTDSANFVSAHIAETPGSFIQAVSMYRDMFSKKGASKNDNYHALSLNYEGKELTMIDEGFMKYHSKEKRVVISRAFKEKADLVTANGGFGWDNKILQEQETHKLILEEIIMALKVQAKGGSFVCKIFECFTETTIQMIAMMTQLYDTIYICKPLTSRPGSSERYLVCTGFTEPKDLSKKISLLEGVLDIAKKEKDKYIKELFKGYEIDKNFRATLINMNSRISNHQFMRINEIIDFVEKQNYRGDTYHQRRKMQIDATKYWVDLFYMDPKEFEKKRATVTNQAIQIVKENQIEEEKLVKRLQLS